MSSSAFLLLALTLPTSIGDEPELQFELAHTLARRWLGESVAHRGLRDGPELHHAEVELRRAEIEVDERVGHPLSMP